MQDFVMVENITATMDASQRFLDNSNPEVSCFYEKVPGLKGVKRWTLQGLWCSHVFNLFCLLFPLAVFRVFCLMLMCA